mgnify:FL=1
MTARPWSEPSTWTTAVCIFILNVQPFLYENSEIPAVENDFQETLKKCQKITQEDYKKQKSFDKIAGRILRVFAPLM